MLSQSVLTNGICDGSWGNLRVQKTDMAQEICSNNQKKHGFIEITTAKNVLGREPEKKGENKGKQGGKEKWVYSYQM